MQEDFQKMRQSFIDALAIQYVIQKKYNQDQTPQINQIKHNWSKVKASFTAVKSQDHTATANSSLEIRLRDLEQHLVLMKAQLLEQQENNNRLLIQNSDILEAVRAVLSDFYTQTQNDIQLETNFNPVEPYNNPSSESENLEEWDFTLNKNLELL